MKEYAEFKKAVRERESSDNYLAENTLGYLGAYQFGMPRLCDFGLTRRKNQLSSSLSNRDFVFTSIEKSDFLNSPGLQDACFDLHVQRLKFVCLKNYPALKDSIPLSDELGSLDLSGAIMVCHLVGPGALNRLIKDGIDSPDAYGTKPSDYAKLFQGFEIPT